MSVCVFHFVVPSKLTHVNKVLIGVGVSLVAGSIILLLLLLFVLVKGVFLGRMMHEPILLAALIYLLATLRNPRAGQ